MYIIVTYYDKKAPWSVSRPFDAVVDGILTDEHCHGSYGLPVIETGRGEVYGPSDVFSITAILDKDQDVPLILRHAKASGYTVKILRSGDPLGSTAETL